MKVFARFLALSLLFTLGAAPAWAQAPTGTTYFSGMSAGTTVAATDTLIGCQVSAGCGSGQTLVTLTPAQISTYMNAHLPTPIGIANGGTNATTASGTALDNITGFSGTGLVNRTGAGTYSFLPVGLTGVSTVVQTTAGGALTNSLISALPFANLATLGGYTTGNFHVLGNPTSGTASPADTTLAAGTGTGLTCTTGPNICTITATGSSGAITTVPGSVVLNDVVGWGGANSTLIDTGLLYTNLVTAGSTLTSNQLVIGGGGRATSTLGSLGSATTVLHGGTGAPSFGAVNLASGGDTTGTLPVASGGTNCSTAGGTCVDNISGFAVLSPNTGALARTGIGSYAMIPYGTTGNSTLVQTSSGGTISSTLVSGLPFANLATLAATTTGTIHVLGNPTAGVASPIDTSLTAGTNVTISCTSPTCTISAAGGGAGAGTVNSGTGGQAAYYATTGTAVSGSSGLSLSSTQLTGMVIGLGSDATGDIYYRNSAGNFTRLGIGGTGSFLSVATGLPAWVSAVPAASLSGTLQAAQMPALTGDVSNTAGSLATVVGRVNGVTYPASPATATVPQVTAANTVTYTTIASIHAAPGPIGSTTPSTGAFTTLSTTSNTTLGGTLTAASLTVPSGNIAGSICSTSAGLIMYNVGANCFAGGTVTFSNLTSGTNTVAAMVVGTGASITASGGTITATGLAGTALPSNIVSSSLTSFGASPAFTTPNIGVATGTSLLASAGVSAGGAPLLSGDFVSPNTGGLAAQETGGTVRALLTMNASNQVALGSGFNPTVINGSTGVQVGAPTGGFQGVGTINAQGLFVNGAAVGTGTGNITASGTITTGAIPLWASSTALSGTLVPGTGVTAALGAAVGSAGGIATTTSALTANTIPRASSAGAIVNSSLIDNGTTINTTEPITISGAKLPTTVNYSIGWAAGQNPAGVPIVSDLPIAMTVSQINARLETPEGAAGTVDVYAAPSGQACTLANIANMTKLDTTAALQLNNAAATNQVLFSGSTISVAAGSSICLVPSSGATFSVNKAGISIFAYPT